MALSGEFSYERVASASVVEQLSNRGGKVLEVVEDNDGRFVRRSYGYTGKWDIESCNRSFRDAWTAYNEMLSNAGIAIIDSELFIGGEYKLPVIASAYVENVGVKLVRDVPLIKKVQAATSLGSLLSSHEWFLPSAQGFQNDGFVAENGEVVLIDVDPYIKQRHRGLDTQSEQATLRDVQGAFMLRGASIIDSWSVEEQELRALGSAFVTAIGDVVTDSPELALSDKFGIPHLISNGFTYEEARLAFSK